MAKTGLVYHPDYLKHDTGSHPESSSRLSAIMNLLKEKKVEDKLVNLSPWRAKESRLELIHTPGYIKEVESACKEGRGWLDADTVVCPFSYEVALLAAGGVMRAVEAVISEEVDNAFALVRPPGHHAEKDRGGGFCLFSNVALASRYAQKEHNIDKVLIVDWDLHHGNGTQNAFYTDSSVLYFSTHQYPYYPGSGSVEEKGEGEGKGWTVNVPLSPGCSDADYEYIFKEILVPVASLFKPNLILVSAGFDTHYADPLGGMNLSAFGFAKLAQIVKGLAEELSLGRLVITLEGGYNLKALSFSVLAVLNILGDWGVTIEEPFSVPEGKEVLRTTKNRVEEVRSAQIWFKNKI